MDPLVLHDPAARGVWLGAIGAWVISELALLGRRGSRGSFRDPSYPVVLVAIGGGFVLARNLADRGVLGGGWAAVAAGVAVAATGIGFRLWSIRTLGAFFTTHVTILPGHRVVQSGPYRLLRHPSYTGLLVALLGLGIALDSWLSIVSIVLLPLAGLLVRIRVEERALETALGDEYRRYAAETSRLVPGVW